MSALEKESQCTDRWVIDIVEKGFVGEYTDHVLDNKDCIHIAYFDYITGNLKHAQFKAGGYAVEIVDQEGTVGQYLSMVTDNKDKIYISYRDQGKNRLKMAVLNQDVWTTEIVDTEPFASLDTSIFVDQEGKIYISYYSYHKGYLKLASKDKGQWQLEIVDDGEKQSNAVGGFSCVKADSLGRVHISYIDSANGLLKYAIKENDICNIEVADDSEFVGNFTSLALDKYANPYISYTVDKRPNKPDLWLARKVEGKWVNKLVDTAEVSGNYSSIAVGQDEKIYISYSSMKKLKMAAGTGDHWIFEEVDSEGTITATSISLDKKGRPHITYHDRDRGVKYARKGSGSEKQPAPCVE
jgi:hypothetical protein